MALISSSAAMLSLSTGMAVAPNYSRMLLRQRAPRHLIRGRSALFWARQGSTDLNTAHPIARKHTLPSKSPTGNPSRDSEFYDRYSNKKIRFSQPHEVTSAGLRALLQDRSITSDFEKSSGDPMRIFADHSTSMNQAIANLGTVIEIAHSRGENREAARDHLQSLQAGSRALAWFLESCAYRRFDVLLYPKFIKLLAHALTAQNADSQLWDLLLSKETPSMSGAHLGIWKS